MSISTSSAALPPQASQPGIKLALDALSRLRFGTIQLTVHEGRLVQVDVTERNRFSAT